MMITTVLLALLQAAAPAATEVHPDRTVTFRLRAPKAQEVKVLSGELKAVLGGASKPLEKDEKGLWSVKVGPVEPGIYDYAFEVDGLRIADPAGEHVFGNRRGARGYLEVPGLPGAPRSDEWRDVPHGAVTAHWYAGAAGRRRLHVYTPPGYAKDKDAAYPLLVLLHGSGDNDSHWTLLGQANVIADNLLADGKAVPMVIAMTDGHVAIPDVAGEEPDARRARAASAYERDLMDHVLPLLESSYRLKPGREHRAIVGLSMGGGQSLGVGLRNPDRFAWIGGFSASTRGWEKGVPGMKATPAQLNESLRLLWIQIGKEDFLLPQNRSFEAWLKESGVKHHYLETEGAHTWGVWRGYLAGFLPLLFKTG